MLDASQPGIIKVVGLDIHISIILMVLMTRWICFSSTSAINIHLFRDCS